MLFLALTFLILILVDFFVWKQNFHFKSTHSLKGLTDVSIKCGKREKNKYLGKFQTDLIYFELNFFFNWIFVQIIVN